MTWLRRFRAVVRGKTGVFTCCIRQPPPRPNPPTPSLCLPVLPGRHRAHAGGRRLNPPLPTVHE